MDSPYTLYTQEVRRTFEALGVPFLIMNLDAAQGGSQVGGFAGTANVMSKVCISAVRHSDGLHQAVGLLDGSLGGVSELDGASCNIFSKHVNKHVSLSRCSTQVTK